MSNTVVAERRGREYVGKEGGEKVGGRVGGEDKERDKEGGRGGGRETVSRRLKRKAMREPSGPMRSAFTCVNVRKACHTCSRGHCTI